MIARALPLPLRAIAVWLLIAPAEVVHGILRMQFVRPLLGDLRARQLAVITGALLILAIAWLARRFLRATTAGQQWAVGALWVALMVSFDLLFGRFVIGYGWARITQDFDPARGGWLGLGLLVMLAAPWLVMQFDRRAARGAQAA
ncbi:MAG: hypothetical protein MUC68_13680 [Burkholderiaceae bacterium]|nr:hypothetical protein [Burkholderiaceae bacterium]